MPGIQNNMNPYNKRQPYSEPKNTCNPEQAWYTAFSEIMTTPPPPKDPPITTAPTPPTPPTPSLAKTMELVNSKKTAHETKSKLQSEPDPESATHFYNLAVAAKFLDTSKYAVAGALTGAGMTMVGAPTQVMIATNKTNPFVGKKPKEICKTIVGGIPSAMIKSFVYQGVRGNLDKLSAELRNKEKTSAEKEAVFEKSLDFICSIGSAAVATAVSYPISTAITRGQVNSTSPGVELGKMLKDAKLGNPHGAFNGAFNGIRETFIRNLYYTLAEKGSLLFGASNAVAATTGNAMGLLPNTTATINKASTTASTTITKLAESLIRHPMDNRGRLLGIGLGCINVMMGGQIWGASLDLVDSALAYLKSKTPAQEVRPKIQEIGESSA